MKTYAATILDHAVAIRRGTRTLLQVPKKERDLVADAVKDERAVLTHLRTHGPVQSEAFHGQRPHVRAV